MKTSGTLIADNQLYDTAFASSQKNTRLFLFLACFFSSTFGGTVSTLMSVYLPVAVKDLLKDGDARQLDNIGAFINSIFIYGWMVGGIVWGILCDRIGRKKSFIYSTCCYGIFTLATAFASTWVQLVVCRFLTGFGVGGVLVTTTMLVSEAFSEKKRAVALGVLSISIPVGIFSAGLINYFIASWRYGFVAGLVPVIIAILSLKYISSGAVVGDMYRRDGAVSVGRIFEKEVRKNLVAGSLIFGTTLIGLWAIFSWLPSWIQTLVVGSDGQKERGIAMMLMGIGGLTGGFISGWIVNAVGVRKTMIICFVVCFALSLTLFKLTHTLSAAVYAQIACMALFFGISQGALSVYIPQLFPASIGATATGFCFNVGRLFTATIVFFIGSLVDLLGGFGNSIFTFSFVFLIGLVVSMLFKPESYSPSKIN